MPHSGVLTTLLVPAARTFSAVATRAAAKKEKMMWETLREAIDEEMEADPTVLVMGMQPPSSNHPVISAYAFYPIRPCMLVPDLHLASLLEFRPNFFQIKFTQRYPELTLNF